MTAFFALASLMVVGSLFWLLRPLHAGTRGRMVDSSRRVTTGALIVVVPAAAAVLYAGLGRLDAVAPAPADPVRAMAEERMARLAARLDTSPDDVAGWRLMARSHEQLRQFPQAVRVYRRLVTLQPGDPDALADLADAIASTQGGNYVGEPVALAQRALTVDADDARALAIVGNEAAQRDDPQAAIATWERMLSIVRPGSEVERSLRLNIDAAQAAIAAKRRSQEPAAAAPATPIR